MEQLKAALRSTWTAGDFGVIAKMNTAAAEAFVQRLGIGAGARVLDVATGTGNVAIPLARSGCTVTGVDIAPNLLQQARERAAAERLDVRFEEGDAEALPYPDASFDVAVTMFGAMFAPRPELVAAEFARVLKPGGLLAMANWTPEGFSGAMFRTTARHVSPPPGMTPPVLWGHAETVAQRLSPGFEAVETERIAMDFEIPGPPAKAVELFRTWFGPTKHAFERLDESGQAALERDLVHLWSGANVAQDPSTHTVVRNEYLQVTARRREG